jgi:hypothetical protein
MCHSLKVPTCPCSASSKCISCKTSFGVTLKGSTETVALQGSGASRDQGSRVRNQQPSTPTAIYPFYICKKGSTATCWCLECQLGCWANGGSLEDEELTDQATLLTVCGKAGDETSQRKACHN